MYLIKIMESHYCKIIFVIMSFIAYLLLPIKNISGWHYIPTITFIILFALTTTCLIRNIKERIILQHKAKASWITIIASAIGLSALQICGLGGPVCGASIGLSILSFLLPNVALQFLTQYHIYLIFIAIFLQLLSLYFLKCFTTTNKN